MDLPDLVLHQIEGRPESAVEQIGLIGVPAHLHAGVVPGVVHDLADGRQPGRLGAVHFELDRYPVIARGRAALGERLADLLQGLFFRRPLRDAVGPHLDAGGADVAGEHHPGLRLVDVPPDHRRIRGVVLADRPEAPDLHRRILEPLPDLRPFRGGERDLHPVVVGRPKLDPVHPYFGQVLDDGRDIPVGRDVVGDRPELQGRRSCRRGPLTLCSGKNGQGRQRPCAREELAPVHCRPLATGPGMGSDTGAPLRAAA